MSANFLEPFQNKVYVYTYSRFVLYVLIINACDKITFELREVVALFKRESRSLSSKGVDMSVSRLTHLVEAFWKDSEMVVG